MHVQLSACSVIFSSSSTPIKGIGLVTGAST